MTKHIKAEQARNLRFKKGIAQGFNLSDIQDELGEISSQCADIRWIAEGEFGLEHADGTWGCKHPRNWAEKRSNEHDTALGEMGTDMGIEMSYSKEDFELLIDCCKHMVGLDYKTPYHRHGKAFYRPYRNHYCDTVSGNKLLDKLPDFIVRKERGQRGVTYVLTRDGLDWLGRQLQITIKNVRD